MAKVHKCGKGSDGRVFWTPEEWEKVLKAYHSMVVKNTVPSKSEEAMREAQKVLPKDRWRSFKYSAQAAKPLKMYREMVKTGLITNLPKAAAEKLKITEPVKRSPPPAASPTPPTSPTIQPGDVQIGGQIISKSLYDAIVGDHLTKNPPPPPRRPSLDEAFSLLIDERLGMLLNSRLSGILQSFDAAFAEHVKAVDSRITYAFTEGNRNIQEMFRQQGEHIKAAVLESNVRVMQVLDPAFKLPETEPAASPPPATKPEIKQPNGHRKLRVLVAGGEPRFGQTIKERFPQIEVVHYDQHGLDNRQLQGDWDLVISNRWINHSMEGRLKKAFGDRYVHVQQGAITSVANTIQQRLHIH